MKLYKNKFKVDSARLKNWDYSTPWWYYITICTKDMINWFGEIKNGKMVLNELGNVIMPNHFHGVVIINDVETSRRDVSKEKLETGHRPVSTHLKPDSLGSVIGQFKSICTKRIRKLGIERFKWQTRFYDHIIRNENDLRRIRTYIQNNPLKWELDEYYR